MTYEGLTPERKQIAESALERALRYNRQMGFEALKGWIQGEGVEDNTSGEGKNE